MKELIKRGDGLCIINDGVNFTLNDGANDTLNGELKLIELVLVWLKTL